MNYEMFQQYLLNNNIVLNKQQETAMRVVKGPTLLLAVPGSGKTTTIIARIGYMIHCNRIDPEKILVLTYTNAATNDMRKRYISIFGNENGNMVKFQTINSLCNGIVREYYKESKLEAPKLVEDNTKVIIDVYTTVYEEYPSEGDVSEAQRVISYIKNMMLDEGKLADLKLCDYEAKPFYVEYCREMKSRNAIDFDDQLVLSYAILNNHVSKLESISNQYPYVLVDEAQDTSKIQHEIIKLIARKTQNIFMVGDEDQSIYGFRAAYPNALLDFEKQYKDAKVLLLEQNYRSTPQIVKTAKHFIELNKNRKQKDMFTERPNGLEVKYVTFNQRKQQYLFLTNQLSQLKQIKQKTAILYRNNDSAVPLVYYLQGAKIPYSSRGIDTAFFNHRAVRDVRLFFEFASDPTNPELFHNIYHRTFLKIKKAHAVETINGFNPDVDRTLWHTYRRLFTVNNPGKQIYVDKVIAGFDALRKDDAWNAIRRIRYQLREETNSEKEKYEVLLFLAKWQESKSDYIKKLDWLEQVIKNGSEDPRGIITLSTVHSSKGLEYDNVFIIDVIDGILPAADTIDEEEERRIFYVAMTRAKNYLTVLRYKDCKMSFVDAIQYHTVVKQKPEGKPIPRPAPLKKPKEKTINQKPKESKTKKQKPAKEKKTIMGFSEGDVVFHTIDGQGRITRITQTTMTVKYKSGIERTLETKTTISKGILRKQ